MFIDQDISLRERKQAKTKVALAKEFLEILKKTKYEDISVKKIYERAEVSEGTFYNYFPQKTDLFNYIIGLYGMRNILVTNNRVSKDDPIKWLEIYFDNVVDMMIELGNLSDEILSTIIRERIKPQKIDVTRREFLYMFPDINSEKYFQGKLSIEDSFDEPIEKMKKKRLLRKGMSTQDASTALKLIFGGVPLIRIIHGNKNIREIVRKQFSIVLRGITK